MAKTSQANMNDKNSWSAVDNPGAGPVAAGALAAVVGAVEAAASHNDVSTRTQNP